MKNYSLLLLLTILGTTQLKAQWTDMLTPSSYHLYTVEAVTNDIIFAGGYGGSLVKTTNAGDNWELVPIGTSNWIKSIHFFNTSDGWLVTSPSSILDSGEVMKTTDGGLNWTTVHNAHMYFSMSWVSQTTGFIGTWEGTIIKTSDGGQNWSQLTAPSTSNIPSLQFLDSQSGFAISTDYYLHKTLDGGITWESFYHPGIRSIFFHDQNNGFCVDSYGRIGKTTDGGETFTYWQSTFIDYKLQDVYFTGASNGYVIGGLDCTNGSCDNKPVILTTNDGGISWTNNTNHPLMGQGIGFYEIDCTPNGTPFLAGSNSVILKKESSVDITDFINEASVLISPNPNSGKFSMNLPESSEYIRVHSASGKIIYEHEIDSFKNIQMNLQTIEKGVYFLSIENENGTYQMEKLILN